MTSTAKSFFIKFHLYVWVDNTKLASTCVHVSIHEWVDSKMTSTAGQDILSGSLNSEFSEK